MITSLGQGDDVNPLIKNYGMVIMDECHHAGAAIAEDVLNAVSAKYVYGLTATPKRDDGQEQKIFMQLGPIRYRYTAKDRAAAQNVQHFVYPRFTRLFAPNANKLSYNQARRVVVDSTVRNELILTDVVSCLQAGRTPLVLTKEKEHAAFLYAQLKPKANHTFLLQGGSSARQKKICAPKCGQFLQTKCCAGGHRAVHWRGIQLSTAGHDDVDDAHFVARQRGAICGSFTPRLRG